MTFQHLLSLLDESGLSPEQLGQRMDISGMTIRRWRSQDPKAEVPKIYRKAFADLVPQLIHEGLISPNSSAVRAIMDGAGLDNFQNIIRNMGISPEATSGAISEESMTQDQTAHVIDSLSQIGVSDKRKKEVERNEKKISGFKKIGPEWAARIATVWKVIRSSEIYNTDKLPAYGALFYLINPFDLIPDFIYGFGLIDDFAILGLAAAYYIKRYNKLFK